MKTFAEPLILYAALFLRFSAGFAPPPAGAGPAEFSAAAEASRLILGSAPSLALVWLALLRAKSLREWGVGLPGKRDALPALASLAAISAIGLAAALAGRHFGGLPEGPRALPPSGPAGWAVLSISVLASAYLEESFFRFYLLSKWGGSGFGAAGFGDGGAGGASGASGGLGPMGIGAAGAVAASTLMFALCHAHLGPWGMANAAASGAALALIFLRTRSLHGAGIAHGIYNMAALALGPAA